MGWASAMTLNLSVSPLIFSRLQFVQIKKNLVEHLFRIQNPNSCGNAYSANSFTNAACKTKWRFVQHPIDQIINKNM